MKNRNLLIPIFYHGLFNCLTLSMITLHVLSGSELPTEAEAKESCRILRKS